MPLQTPVHFSQLSSNPTSRPKRGRRKKRPELTDTQRKALRAIQNRQATRRSRERARMRAQLLRSQLSHSLKQNSLLAAERDRLLATVETRPEDNVCTTATRKWNPMSLDVILNAEEELVHERRVDPCYASRTPWNALDLRRRIVADASTVAHVTTSSTFKGAAPMHDVNLSSRGTSPVSVTTPLSRTWSCKNSIRNLSKYN